MNTVFDCSLITLEKVKNRAGNLSPIEGLKDIPFEIKRVFYIYDIPGGESRGAHAHKECHQLLFAVSGSFDVVVQDGLNHRRITLNRPNIGLYIPPKIWAAETNFSSGAICLVITSHDYNENDYIRNYEEYLLLK
jgi:uncharacterized RmlC-like cupin family protein